ncbi:polymorphic toxin type 44 domain-containing protein [Phytobacter diazotrophicus]|uniref:polymorphic toxin type 44 domain-containing protein n=1 Tax=Phytobacter diazotrophicus TaxID=395631 RepID=UPI001451D109|nr:polymorphic toxin type 44 domain-containing protein [Phytobacter diazotrophicus]QJF19586.1 type IV secretion protein Rhs [Phytobacter diazotrophicus]
MSAIPIAGPGIGIVRNNMKDAHNHGEPRDMALPLTYYWFYQKVRNKGPRDYKQFDPYWAAFGNFNFGATGHAAGIPAEILLMGAGWAQSRARTSRPEWGTWYKDAPYGDDPQDQYWIKEGIKYAIENGY